MDYIVYGVVKSWTPLINFHFHFHFLMKFSSFLPFYLQEDKGLIRDNFNLYIIIIYIIEIMYFQVMK